MTAKRAASKPPATGPTSSPPLVNALLLAAAIGYGFYLLIARGRVSWPPTELMSSAFTLAGCLALVGPVVLFRREDRDGGVGNLVWLTGGMLVWIFDLAAIARGEFRSLAWATPLAVLPMGLTIGAVLVAGLRAQGAGKNWSWTNVTGWLLGLFWIGMALASLAPTRGLGLAAR